MKKPITVKDLIHNLEDFFKPNAELVYLCDDKRNQYKPVYYTPTIGKYIDGKFYIKDDMDNEEYDKLDGKEVICIN